MRKLVRSGVAKMPLYITKSKDNALKRRITYSFKFWWEFWDLDQYRCNRCTWLIYKSIIICHFAKIMHVFQNKCDQFIVIYETLSYHAKVLKTVSFYRLSYSLFLYLLFEKEVWFFGMFLKFIKLMENQL